MIAGMTQTEKRPNPDTNKHQYSSRLSFFFSLFFIHLLVTDSFGKFQSVAFKVLHEQTGQFSDALVPGIRLLTGSKVHTATAGTFTLGGGSRRARRHCSVSSDRKCSASTGGLTLMQNWRKGRV